MKEKFFFLLFLLSFSVAYSQSSIGDNPYFYMMATKSMKMKNGKIDFVEYKRVKGTKEPIVTYYTLVFSKDISYKTENKKINIHFFNERDSILYIAGDKDSYVIDYKKKEVVFDERDEVIFMIRKNYPFANFYSNQAGSNLLLMGRIRDSVKTDFSTTISTLEQNIFTEMYNLHPNTSQGSSLGNKLFCYDKYEFRNIDTLLIQYVSKISNPQNYKKGTVVEIETTLLHAILEDQEYEKPYYYDYTGFYKDDFYFYDKRKHLVANDDQLNKSPQTNETSLQSMVPEKKKENIRASDFLELENEMMSLYMQVKEEQLEMVAQKKIRENHALSTNFEALPAKNSQTIPLEATGTAKIESLSEVQRKNLTNRETDLFNQNAKNRIADNQKSPVKNKFENFLLEKSAEEAFLTTNIAELKTEYILIEEITLENYKPTNNQIADFVFVDTTTEVAVEFPVLEEQAGLIEDIKVEIILLDPFGRNNQASTASASEPMYYYIVLKYIKDVENAETFFEKNKEIYDNLLYLGKELSSDTFMVRMGPYQTESEARDILENMKEHGLNGWLLVK